MAGRQHTTMPLFKRRSGNIVGRLIGGIAALVVLAALAAAPARAQSDGPSAVIERLHAALLEVMQDADELGYEGRYQRLEPVVKESYDFPFMTRIASATDWRDMSPEQKEQLIALFAEMSIASYAARFDGYGGQSFEVTGEAPGPRDAVVVESRLLRPDDEPIALNYVMREQNGAWRIVDVLLEGKFSELARQKSEFSAVLREGGVPDLIALLREKIAELEAEASS